MVSLQLIAELGTIVITLLTVPLAVYITTKYMKGKGRPYLYWSIGMWAFAVAAFEEIVFAFNYYDPVLINIYFFLVAMVVLFLSLGSVELIKSAKIKKYYMVFSILATILLIYSLVVTPEPGQSKLITGYVVTGLPALFVIITSSIIVYPASAALVVIALKSYLKRRVIKPLYIIAGVIVISAAGSLYLLSFPIFLYFSEFIGIVLLWLGLV
jgi:hypothetical protein